MPQSTHEKSESIAEAATARPTAPLHTDASALRDSGDRLRSGRLAGLSMWHAIWVLSWPVVCEMFLASLVGLVDTSLAARVSEAATDAIGATAYFMWFIGMVGMALGVGVTAMVSRAVGRGRFAIANATLGQATIASVTSGVVVGGMIYALAPSIAVWLNLSEEASHGAVLYLRITAFGVPASNFLAAGIAACRGAGNTRTPLLIMLVVNMINIFVSFALSGVDIGVTSIDEAGQTLTRMILRNPFGFDLGIVGIAIGTLAAWLFAVALIGASLVRGTHGIRLRARRLRLHWHTMRRLIKLGMTNFFEMMSFWLGNFVVILIVGWMSLPGLLGSHIVAVRIEAFSFLPGFAMGLSAATLVGQYLGMKRPDLARLAIRRCAMVGVSIMTLFGLAFIFAPGPIVGVFSQQPLHLELVPQLLLIAGLIQIPFGLAIVLRSALQGAGDTTVALVITLATTYLVRIPLAWLCSGVDMHLPSGLILVNPAPLAPLGIAPLVGLWIGLCAEIIVRCLIFGARFLQGGWTRVRV